jgi:hypothetical protein
VRFSDPAFPISTRGVAAMWRMLCERGKDLACRLRHRADASTGARTVVRTTRIRPPAGTSRTGSMRRSRSATAASPSHRDRFDLYRWARQALGVPGLLLGWSPPMQSAIRRKAAAALAAWRASSARGPALVTRVARFFSARDAAILAAVSRTIARRDSACCSSIWHAGRAHRTGRAPLPRAISCPTRASSRFPRVWQPILHGVSCARARRSRARSTRRSGARTARRSSPTACASARCCWVLGERLKAMGLPSDHARSSLAMRYGNPSIAQRARQAAAPDCERILVVPLYPQYAASTHRIGDRRRLRAPADDAPDAGAALARLFPRRPGYIRRSRACQRLLDEARAPRSRRAVVPRPAAARARLGDPYHCHCQKTARLLAPSWGLIRRNSPSPSSRGSARRNG